MKIVCLLMLFAGLSVNAQSIVSWTEQNGVLGLGYPVPIPVDTPESFDGFRTYAGLFAKHQSLAMTNDYITGYVVGQTRNDRDIWAYKLSDNNNLTQYGVKEGVMLVNGTIHAREWQSPEVLTEIMELLDRESSDHGLHQYLLENTTIMALPVNNVDGFLQTQRYPEQNWYLNSQGPRDGRMRRKNMIGVDEDLFTQNDYLLGVDLNRNNDPYWATSTRSSSSMDSIVYHGASQHSEPETQARLAMVDLIDPTQLRVYTDVHSFSQVLFSVRTNNSTKNVLQDRLLSTFSRHQAAFPERKNYINVPNNSGFGVGSTDEYFGVTYQIPSWTLEIEPRNGSVEYGGFGNDGHDGFILPESEIARVRAHLSQSFMVAWYQQAGVPSITRVQVVEVENNTVVYDAQWDIGDENRRVLHEQTVDNLRPNIAYNIIVHFDKPMRVRDENDVVVELPGQTNFQLQPEIDILNVSGVSFSNPKWLNTKSESLYSYAQYKDDSFVLEFSLPESTSSAVDFSINAKDFVGQLLDANPETVSFWSNGGWQGYDDDNGENLLNGGVDNAYSAPFGESRSSEFIPSVQPSGMYYDSQRSGEGFAYDLLPNNQVWLQWFTYDENGNPKWYTGIGDFLANRIFIKQLNETSGGFFGSAFDATQIERKDFGQLEIVFNGGERMPPVGYQNVARTAIALYTDNSGKKLRTNFEQLSIVKGALNLAEHVELLVPEISPVGMASGSWYDPNRSGEGYVLEILENGKAVVFWFTYDTQGNHLWLLGSQGEVRKNGLVVNVDFNDVRSFSGAVFGQDFKSEDIENHSWGELHFELTCGEEGVVNYNSSVEGYGSGSHPLVKLTNPLTIPYVCE